MKLRTDTEPSLPSARASQVAAMCGRRAENLFKAHKLCCSEALIVTINQGLGCGLEPELALGLGSGYCHGMGGAGCVCGALAGGELMLSLVLGPRRPAGLAAKAFERLSRRLHDRFRARFGATCCRVLTRRRKEKQGASCQELTGGGAELVASLLLAQRPALLEQVDEAFLRRSDSRLAALLSRRRSF